MAKAFRGRLPMWLIESEPWHTPKAGQFLFYRETMLGLTQEECAAYLGVLPQQVGRWESGACKFPKSAFEALRLLSNAVTQRLSHGHWDGWFVNRNTGELTSPDIGRLAVRPEEINHLPILYSTISIMKDALERQRVQIETLQSQNVELRDSDRVRTVVAELSGMQKRITEILDSVETAEVFTFMPKSGQPGHHLAAA